MEVSQLCFEHLEVVDLLLHVRLQVDEDRNVVAQLVVRLLNRLGRHQSRCYANATTTTTTTTRESALLLFVLPQIAAAIRTDLQLGQGGFDLLQDAH